MEFFANVDLVNVKFQLKIGDFGFSKFLDNCKTQRSETMCGTPLYMSPQIVDDTHYTYKTDIWSLGVIYYELLTGKYPFNGDKMSELGKNLNHGFYTLELKKRPSLECLQILTGCLNQNEDERISILDLCDHPYLSADYEPHSLPNILMNKSRNLSRNSTIDQSMVSGGDVWKSSGNFRITLSSKDSAIPSNLS